MFDLFTQVWQQRSFAATDGDDLDGPLVDHLTAYRRMVGGTLPVGATYTLLSCWTTLYGLVSLEVFNHLRFGLDDAEPFFEAQLRVIAGQLGMAPS